MSDDLNRSIELHTCRQHHVVIRFIANDIPVRQPFDANEARMLLWRLKTVLTRHLALEDEELYPALRMAQNETISTLAEQYQNGMGHLRDEFLKLCTRWDDAARIAAFPQEFLHDWLAIREALLHRMNAEDDTLYKEAQVHFDDRLRNRNAG